MFLIFREIPADFPESFLLAPDEYRHLRARRIRPGGAVHVGDGQGRRLEYRLRDSGDSIVRVADAAPATGAEALVELFTAVPDGRRWDWLLQKATELGATAIQPVRFEYSEARRLKREREERIILEAAVQSRRFILPELRDELSLSQVLRDNEQHDLRGSSGASRDFAGVALDPRGDQALVEVLQDTRATGRFFTESSRRPAGAPRALRIMVGPEGGFSEDELGRLKSVGFGIVRLGDAILRVETAALAGLACVAACAITAAK